MSRFSLIRALMTVGMAAIINPMAAFAASPSWSDWERANAVAQKGQWLVVRQPNEGFCYIKQGYEGHSDKMDSSMKADGKPYLTTPFFRGIEGCYLQSR